MRTVLRKTAYALIFCLISLTISSAQTKNSLNKSKPPATADSSSSVMVNVGSVKAIDPAKASGNKNARIVLEVFSDYQCPSCKQLFVKTNQRLMDDYVNSGKIFIVHRDFPLPMHRYSQIVASYARAAAHIGRGETVDAALFQGQDKWETSGDVRMIVAGALTPAEMKRVQALVDAKALEPLIDKDKQIGEAIPIKATPTMLFHTTDGQIIPLTGSVDYGALKAFLDQLLKQ